MKKFICIRNIGCIYERLVGMGYEMRGSSCYVDQHKWIFICISDNDFGQMEIFLVGDLIIEETDVEINIDDIPLRKDLNDFVSILKEGSKLGLL